MVIDLSDVKVGDKLFEVSGKELEVITVETDHSYPIKVRVKESRYLLYRVDGRWDEGDPYPTLFHSKKEAGQYFLDVSIELLRGENGN